MWSLFLDLIPIRPVQNNYLYLDHQNLTFDENYVTFTSKPTKLDCNMYVVTLRDQCGYSSQMKDTLVVSSQCVVIDRNALSNADVNIVNKDDHEVLCQMMEETFQLHKSGKQHTYKRILSSLTNFTFQLLQLNY